MAWRIKDEWIDHAKGQHVVLYENPDIQIPIEGSSPVRLQALTYSLTNHLKLPACPHCGRPTGEPNGVTLDFHKEKTEILKSLNNHHRKMLAYLERHTGVRVGSGPKR